MSCSANKILKQELLLGVQVKAVLGQSAAHPESICAKRKLCHPPEVPWEPHFLQAIESSRPEKTDLTGCLSNPVHRRVCHMLCVYAERRQACLDCRLVEVPVHCLVSIVVPEAPVVFHRPHTTPLDDEAHQLLSLSMRLLPCTYHGTSARCH